MQLAGRVMPEILLSCIKRPVAQDYVQQLTLTTGVA
jgi:hypothetical protein